MPANIVVTIDNSLVDQDILDLVPHTLGRMAVQALQAPDSLWPVKTSFSKRSFGYRVVGGRVEITNTANYAIHVEERTNAAYNTIVRALPEITSQIRDDLLEVFANRIRLGVRPTR